ncbi:UNVERIFIED_CONTAM: hypothetical protein GTU68_012454 [Idotea baltica]|nr:hypothetical protein [Idotea baltica]
MRESIFDPEKRTIRQWRREEQPRAKLAEKGAGSLTEAELIAILLGSGTHDLTAVDVARTMLRQYGNLSQLARLGVKDLCKVKGIGLARASFLLAAFELGRRKMSQKARSERLSTAKAIAMFAAPMLIDLGHEEFYAIFLNNSLRLLGYFKVSQGGVSSTSIDPKLIFREAALHRAPCLAICHNHPSGNPQPSQADHQLTRRLLIAGEIMDCKVVDHLIIGQNGYYSYQESGMMAMLLQESTTEMIAYHRVG